MDNLCTRVSATQLKGGQGGASPLHSNERSECILCESKVLNAILFDMCVKLCYDIHEKGIKVYNTLGRVILRKKCVLCKITSKML